MNTIIVSDLHIGSRYFLYKKFERFLRNIPDNYEIILNGDIIDSHLAKINQPHLNILNILEQLSYRQRVLWVCGNHDIEYIPQALGNIEFKRQHSIENRLLIIHGDTFDDVLPHSKVFTKIFVLLHNFRIMLGARPVHKAQYAKKLRVFYKFFCKKVMMNAANYALKNGYDAVTCGHTHYAEDVLYNGVRYINTGAWTESPSFYLHRAANEMTLKGVD